MKRVAPKAVRRRMPALACAAAVMLAGALLSACRDSNPYLSRRDTIRLGAGDAMAHNRAVHTIDPWPAYAKDTRIDADGKRMLLAVDRYQNNQSIEPTGIETAGQFAAEGAPPPPPPPAPPAP